MDDERPASESRNAVERERPRLGLWRVRVI